MVVPRDADAGPTRLLYRPEGAARQLDMSRAKLFRLLASGQIDSVKIDGIRRIPHSSLVAYVERISAEQSAA
ncbi:conserved hypothetical protein [Parafrankia sp. EAN1pec]|uniref:helix-turn-helix domain-containing protein n=1 Tax=Parafrankia sp. (strain EAN1pec) TaxID=298653 RepID=UPI00015D9E15|nr:conserved hypothetical protein [Frankia sp. EAN1pec]